MAGMKGDAILSSLGQSGLFRLEKKQTRVQPREALNPAAFE
jgi:hypothetical protein